MDLLKIGVCIYADGVLLNSLRTTIMRLNSSGIKFHGSLLQVWFTMDQTQFSTKNTLCFCRRFRTCCSIIKT